MLLLALATASCVLVNGRVSANDDQAPMQKYAERVAQGPMKLDVRPISRFVPSGGKVTVEILVLNADNQPASWNQKSELRVEVIVTGPSKKSKVFPVSINPGQSAVQVAVPATEAGLHSLKVREVNDRLLPGGNSVLVRKPVAFWPDRQRQSMNVVTVALRTLEPPAVPAGAAERAQEPDGPLLLLQDASGREVLADGKDFARIKVHLLDGEAARDTKVWLKWSNGELSPQPLVIKQGDSAAEAHWVSSSPVEATVSLVSSAPRYAVEQPSELKVSFVSPIYGIEFLNLNPLSLWLTDYVPVHVAFFDSQGRPVQSGKRRTITFTPSNLLRVDRMERNVERDDSGTSIFVWPTWHGQSILTVSTPGYLPRTLDVVVAVWLVAVLCVAGGVMGGLAAAKSLNKSTLRRVFVGVLGAVGLVWICVYAVLPETSSIIAHNLVSVLVVGIVGGYGGTRVLDFLGKKLGFA
jgi:hypothetical protein